MPGILHAPVRLELKVQWSKVILILGLACGLAILLFLTLASPSPKSLTVLVSIILSGLYTLALYLTRGRWTLWLAKHPLRNACLLGVLNAAIVETIFWAVQGAFGAMGVAASSILPLDLFITMPWYAGMVILFVRAQDRRRFPAPLVLLLGGLYETFTDGIVGNMIFGHQMFLPGAWVLLALSFWGFILVYSSMVLPPALLVQRAKARPVPSYPAWADALSPLLWLILYAIFLAILLGAI
jgi:hypothetical protein